MKFMAYHAERPPPAGEIHNPNPPARADPRRSPPAAKINNPNPLEPAEPEIHNPNPDPGDPPPPAEKIHNPNPLVLLTVCCRRHTGKPALPAINGTQSGCIFSCDQV